MKYHLSLILCLFLLCNCNRTSDSAKSLYNSAYSFVESKLNKNEDDSVKNVVSQQVNINFTKDARAVKLMNERRIYLVDLTRSTEGFNGSENIFDNLKTQLHNAITAINDTSTEIIIIPFTDQPKDLFNKKISQKKELLEYIAKLSTKTGDTNIIDAWKKGESLLDSTKINYMFMLTDGVHNYGEPIDSLYKTLNNWHNVVNGKYQFSFYVLLSESAKEQEICRIVNSSKQMWLVPTMNIQTDFIIGSMNQSVNIIKSNWVKLHLSCTNPEIFNQGFKFKISIPENEYYRIVNADEIIDGNGDVTFEIKKLKQQKDLPISYKTKILITYDKEKFPFVFFTPEEYNLTIANVGVRKINIKKPKK